MSFEQTEQNDAPQGISKNSQHILEQAIVNIERLHHVYESETRALDTADTQEFLTLQSQKFQAAQSYQSCIQEILNRKDEMKDMDPAMKEKLVQMQRDFSVLAEKNLQALSRMQGTVTRLGNTIRRAATDAARRQMSFSYGETGKLEDTPKKGISIGLNESA